MTTSVLVPSSKNNLSTYKGDLKLGRHQKFYLREAWLPKLIDFCREPNLPAFAEDGIHHEFGVGKNMFTSMFFWAEASGIFRRCKIPNSQKAGLELTDLGMMIAEEDPFFEDRGSSWIVHINLTQPTGPPGWYWFFNELRFSDGGDEYLGHSFSNWLSESKPENTWKQSFIDNEIRCVTDCYTLAANESNLTTLENTPLLGSLNLLSRSPRQLVRSSRSLEDLPLNIFLYGCALFREIYDNPDPSLDDLLWLPNGPGRTFGLDSDGLELMLDQAEASGDFTVRTENTGLYNVHIPANNPQTYLQRHFRHAEN